MESDLFHIDEGCLWANSFVKENLICSESKVGDDDLVRRLNVDQTASVVRRCTIPEQLEVEITNKRVLNENSLVQVLSIANLVTMLDSDQAGMRMGEVLSWELINKFVQN